MSQVATTFAYNGSEFDFDIRDTADAEKLEEAIDVLDADEKSIPKTGKISEIGKAQCIMLRKFLDNVLEPGAGVKLCGEKMNLAAHYDAYHAFLEYCNVQKDDLSKKASTFSRYSNRQQRRAAAKGKKNISIVNKDG